MLGFRSLLDREWERTHGINSELPFPHSMSIYLSMICLANIFFSDACCLRQSQEKKPECNRDVSPCDSPSNSCWSFRWETALVTTEDLHLRNGSVRFCWWLVAHIAQTGMPCSVVSLLFFRYAFVFRLPEKCSSGVSPVVGPSKLCMV